MGISDESSENYKLESKERTLEREWFSLGKENLRIPESSRAGDGNERAFCKVGGEHSTRFLRVKGNSCPVFGKKWGCFAGQAAEISGGLAGAGGGWFVRVDSGESGPVEERWEVNEEIGAGAGPGKDGVDVGGGGRFREGIQQAEGGPERGGNNARIVTKTKIEDGGRASSFPHPETDTTWIIGESQFPETLLAEQAKGAVVGRGGGPLKNHGAGLRRSGCPHQLLGFPSP